MIRRCVGILVALFAASSVAPTQAQSVNMTNPTVANGGGVIEAGPFRMLVTMGEPAVSQVSANGFVLTSGLQAVFLENAGLLPDAVFSNGFETPPAANARPSGDTP